MRKEVQIQADQVLAVQEWIHSVQETSTQFCQGHSQEVAACRYLANGRADERLRRAGDLLGEQL